MASGPRPTQIQAHILIRQSHPGPTLGLTQVPPGMWHAVEETQKPTVIHTHMHMCTHTTTLDPKECRREDPKGNGPSPASMTGPSLPSSENHRDQMG